MPPLQFRSLLLFASVLIAPKVALSQASGLGIKGGPLMSDIHSGATSSEQIPGGTVGMYFPLHGGARFELQPELLLTSLGAGYEDAEGERSSVRTLYVQVPIAAKLFLGNTLNVHGGVLGGRLLAAQQYTPDGNSDLRDSYRKMDWGVILGLGADLRSGVDFTFRYYSGMAPLLVDDETLFPRNRSMELTVGYRFMRFKVLNHGRRRK